MKTFLICPVRGHDKTETQGIVDTLEATGWEVHWPHRDTDQDDISGLRICNDNRKAINDADAIHIVYDPTSKGSHFDMGMAFMANKPIRILSMTEYKKDKKSFFYMLEAWEKEGT